MNGETKEGMSERPGTTNGRDNTRSQKAAFRVQNWSSTKRQSMPVKTDRKIEAEEEKWSDQDPAGLEGEEEQTLGRKGSSKIITRGRAGSGPY